MKMNAFLVTVLSLALPLVLCYDEKYDKIDIDKIIADDALFSAYADCMLNRGPCNVEHSEELKNLLPEVISTVCEKCTPIQKDLIKKTVKALAAKRPADFEALYTLYDPEKKIGPAFLAFALSE